MNTNTQTQEPRGHRFLLGLLTGTFVAAGLAMWFAPRSVSELRQRVADTAKGLGDRVSHQYQRASDRVGDAVDDLTRKGQDVRDDIADVVAHGAHEVEHYATAARTDGTADATRSANG